MPWIHSFGAGRTSDEDAGKHLLGGKGAGLASMSRMGLPVPPGFTLTTEACSWFFEHGQAWPEGLGQELADQVASLEAATGKRFGDPEQPLLVSVRSGAAISMPGMMDTVLNLGMNDTTVAALARGAGERFAWDSYRRFVQMFADIVLGVHFSRMSRAADAFLGARKVEELDAAGLKELTQVLKGVIAELGRPFPDDPMEQLEAAVNAVFRSYNSHRARYYRKSNGISDLAGTAVNVQAMVFGNMEGASGTGVCFTRNPKTGARGLFGEWLPNAQGEDVVAGIRTPFPVGGEVPGTLEGAHPAIYARLLELAQQLEQHYGDMQDIEFTIEQGELFLLQTRTGKRSAQAAVQSTSSRRA